MRGSGRAFPQFGENGDLLAVDDRQIGEFEPELRNALDTAGFLSVCDGADDGFTSLRDDPAVHGDGPIERGGKGVAGLIAIAGEGLS